MSDAIKMGIGKIITTEQRRDAIHIAVIPATAGMDLVRGGRVFICGGVAYSTEVHPGHVKGEYVGVVDPYLSPPMVIEGEGFWLFLHPASITSLRHHWSHPMFPDEDVKPVKPDTSPSQEWLGKFCADYWKGSFHEMMAEASDGNLCFGEDDYPDSLSEEFWKHFNAVTGKGIKEGYFRCAC